MACLALPAPKGGIMNTQNNDVDVLIVGAGPTGLTMACELLRRGITCRILDKAATHGMTSRAIVAQARTLEVFDKMGIAEEVLSRGVTGIGIKAYDGDTLLLHMNFRFLANDAIPYPYSVLIPQNVTEELLIDLLHKEGGAVERLKEVTDLRQDADKVVVTVHDLQNDTSEEVQACWVIGCDGVHSRTRKALGLAFEGSTYDEEYLIADVELDWQRSPTDVYLWMTPNGQFGVFPLPNNTWRLLATIPTTDSKEAPQASLEIFQRLLQERTGDRATTISHPIWMSNFKINRRMVNFYRVQRVFLAGDAAHAHSPFGGQGMNTGIQDAHNLAWKLALVIEGKATDALLDTYQEERLPIARRVLAETDQYTKILIAKNPVIRLLRDYVVIPLLRQGFVQRRMLWDASELGINYRTSTLSHSPQASHAKKSSTQKGHTPHPGDRAPDGHCVHLPEKEATTLFQQFRGTTSQLLLFDGLIQTEANYAKLTQIGRRVKEVMGDEVKVSLVVSSDKIGELPDWDGTILLDLEHTLHTRYGAATPSLSFIRPDGYIGFCCQPAEEQPLLDYIGQWFVGSKESVKV
jgi:2-polyprenyl-6-methoxyphenol hydroxylase-like FAD-dependent oxidoreductase